MTHKRKNKSGKLSYWDLSPQKRTAILKWIVKTGSSIAVATKHFNVTSGCIDMIFEQRFKPPKWTGDYKTIE
jgi:hypothetical protein